ncbi:MAG TPA: hypothetical protein VLY23_14090, partial [Candidatus Acidoferrum sp.]|nr:hypothetical protein [Candidatus Acidoferrum sp.]
MRELQRLKPTSRTAAYVGAKAPIHKARRFTRDLLFFFLLPCFFASVSFAGTVTGRVTNGTTGKPAAGVDVILIQLQGTMQPVAQTKTDASGHYQLDHPALGN